MIYFQSLTQSDLAELLLPLSDEHRGPERAMKQARYRAKMIYHWVYQRFVTEWDEMSDLSKSTREWLKANVQIFRLEDRMNRQALDGTHKFLWELPDQKTIESVIIPAALQEKDIIEPEDKTAPRVNGSQVARNAELYRQGKRFSGRLAPDKDLTSDHWTRLTACISSQVGCAMACKFCLTGVQGLDRHLQTHEIVTQVYELRRLAPITNIVFMGMGEPLHNFDNVVKACKIMLDGDGLNFSKRKVTISTSGLVPAIIELGKQVDVSLAISLNGSNDEQRSAIMPVNKKWNIESLMKACREYPLGSHRRITFEYVMLKDFNDSLEDAARVAQLTRGIPSKINLIPFNEHPAAPYKRPTDETVRKFQEYLMDRHIVATVRISRGRDILAACGQLRSIFGTARGSDKHKDWKPLTVVASDESTADVSTA